MIGTGTFGCGSVIVEGEDFIAENITFENSSPEVPLVYYIIYHFNKQSDDDLAENEALDILNLI